MSAQGSVPGLMAAPELLSFCCRLTRQKLKPCLLQSIIQLKKYLRPCKKEEDTFFNQYIFAGPNKIVMSCSTLLYFYHSLNLTLISDQYTHFSSAQCLAQLLYAALCEVPYIPMDFLHIGNLPQNIFLSFFLVLPFINVYQTQA